MPFDDAFTMSSSFWRCAFARPWPAKVPCTTTSATRPSGSAQRLSLRGEPGEQADRDVRGEQGDACGGVVPEVLRGTLPAPTQREDARDRDAVDGLEDERARCDRDDRHP